jgi:hypothetical protein
MSDTGMEYTDGVMEMYITESGNWINKMAKDISGGQMEMMNTGESTRIMYDEERESHKRMEYYTETNTKKTSSSAGFHFSELLQSLSRNK